MAERRLQGNVLMEKEEASEDELEQSNLLTKNDAACREEDGWHSSTAASTCAGGHKSSRTLYSLPLKLQQRTCILSVGAGPCKHDQRHHRTTTPTRLPSAVEGVGHYISRAPCVLLPPLPPVHSLYPPARSTSLENVGAATKKD